jgi:hypothetical protein
MFEKKYLVKAAEEEKKQGRKRKREEAKQEKKKNKVPKRTDKRTVFKKVNDNVECNSVCHICKRRIKCGYELRCHDCQNLYHELYTPKYHKKHIPISEDGDTFLCHSYYKEDTENSADKMTQVEENYDDYDSDINKLYILATQK